jgi:DNA polymerase-3 subunit delta'
MNIIGHTKARERLAGLARQKARPQSYLIAGPAGIGKRSVAYEFAERLTGSPVVGNGQDDPGNLDVLVLRPTEKTVLKKKRYTPVSVEQIREGLVFLSRYPVVGPVRVLIIENAESLMEGAQNALLKTLEEPNGTSILILVATGRGNLLATILSRVQVIPLSLVAEEDLRTRYPRESLPADAPDLFYFLGRPALFERMINQPESVVAQRETLVKLFRIGSLSLADRYALAEELSADGDAAREFLSWWEIGLIRAARAKVAPDRKYYALAETIAETERRLEKSGINVRLQLERLFLRVQ